MKKELSLDEMKDVKGGAAITLTSVMAVLIIGIVAVLCYRLFFSEKGSVTLPGGYRFTWGK